MKKVLAIAVLGMISLASCKKDYTCTCTANNAAVSQKIEIKKAKKKDAESVCSAQNSNYAVYAGGKCELK